MILCCLASRIVQYCFWHAQKWYVISYALADISGWMVHDGDDANNNGVAIRISQPPRLLSR